MSDGHKIRTMKADGEIKTVDARSVWQMIMESVKPKELWDEEDEATLRALSGEEE